MQTIETDVGPLPIKDALDYLFRLPENALEKTEKGETILYRAVIPTEFSLGRLNIVWVGLLLFAPMFLILAWSKDDHFDHESLEKSIVAFLASIALIAYSFYRKSRGCQPLRLEGLSGGGLRLILPDGTVETKTTEDWVRVVGEVPSYDYVSTDGAIMGAFSGAISGLLGAEFGQPLTAKKKDGSQVTVLKCRGNGYVIKPDYLLTASLFFICLKQGLDLDYDQSAYLSQISKELDRRDDGSVLSARIRPCSTLTKSIPEKPSSERPPESESRPVENDPNPSKGDCVKKSREITPRKRPRKTTRKKNRKNRRKNRKNTRKKTRN